MYSYIDSTKFLSNDNLTEKKTKFGLCINKMLKEEYWLAWRGTNRHKVVVLLILELCAKVFHIYISKFVWRVWLVAQCHRFVPVFFKFALNKLFCYSCLFSIWKLAFMLMVNCDWFIKFVLLSADSVNIFCGVLNFGLLTVLLKWIFI